MSLTRFLACVLGAATGPATLAAQGFEGVITANHVTHGVARTETIQVKGARWRMEGGADKILIDDGSGMLMLVSPERHAYIHAPVGFAGANARLKDIALTPTGKRETVAGVSCEYYEAHDPHHPDNGGTACITSDLGFIGITGELNFCAGGEAVHRQFSKGCFMLKQLDAGGKTTFEVTKIEKKPVNDATFAPPAGYAEMKMPGMPAAATH